MSGYIVIFPDIKYAWKDMQSYFWRGGLREPEIEKMGFLSFSFLYYLHCFSSKFVKYFKFRPLIEK